MIDHHLHRAARGIGFVLLLPTLFVLAACNETDRPRPTEQEIVLDEMKESRSLSDSPALGQSASLDAGQEAAPSLQAAARDDAKLIRTANVEMRVENYATARTRIEQITQHFGGFRASEHESRRPEQLRNRFTIRVPAARFEPLLDSLLTVARVVEERSVNVEDVTEQYIDVTARLETKREVEARYLEILDRAQSVEDVLAVERELQTIREEIESMQQRLNHLNDRIAQSTIHLTLYERLHRGPAAAGSFFTRAADALLAGWNGFVQATLLVIRLWPLLLLLGLLVPGAVALYRRHQDSQTGSTSAPDPPAS